MKITKFFNFTGHEVSTNACRWVNCRCYAAL